MNTTEIKIVNGMVRFLAERGWVCGTADPVERVRETGQAWIAFTKGDVRGRVFFIAGNGRDIVSDWSARTDEALATFSVDVDAYLDTLVLCAHVKLASICDSGASDVNAPPTCPTCLRRDPRSFPLVSK